MYQRPQSPLSIGGVLDDGFRLLKASFAKIFPLGLVAAFVSQIPAVMMGPDAMQDPTQIANAFTAPVIVAFILVSLLSVVVYGAIIVRVDATSEGRELTMGEAIGVGLKRFLPLLLCGILYMIAVVLGLFLLIIPGVIIGLTLVFAPYLVITDGMGPMQAMKHSHGLVWGNWWRTAAILSVVMFVLIVGYIVVGLVAGFSAVAASGLGSAAAPSPLFNYVVVPLITAIITPVIYAFSLSILNDLKLRKEGGDLADRIGSIDNA